MKELININTVTPEQAASLTSSCSDIQPLGGKRWQGNYKTGKYVDDGPKRYLAQLWCNYKGIYVAAEGKTILEAVVNVTNKVREMTPDWF